LGRLIGASQALIPPDVAFHTLHRFEKIPGLTKPGRILNNPLWHQNLPDCLPGKIIFIGNSSFNSPNSWPNSLLKLLSPCHGSGALAQRAVLEHIKPTRVHHNGKIFAVP
jgi:hypothetical protein